MTSTALSDRYFEQSRATTGWSSADLFRQGHAVRAFIVAAFPSRSLFDRISSGGYSFRNADRQLQAEVLRRCANRAVRDAHKSS
jgi:hypothetical protein